jgi:hypothetical protein
MECVIVVMVVKGILLGKAHQQRYVGVMSQPRVSSRRRLSGGGLRRSILAQGAGAATGQPWRRRGGMNRIDGVSEE